MYRIPLLPKGYDQEYSIFYRKPGAEIPDIWAYGFHALVSERAKKVLEACDDFGHEYIETELQDERRQRINEQPYYLLNVRRILQIGEQYGKIENQWEMFNPEGMEYSIFPVI